MQEGMLTSITRKPSSGNLGKNPCIQPTFGTSDLFTRFIRCVISWDEIGDYDIPATINYVLKETGRSKLSFIGHSLGCGVFFIAMVKHPELNAKIDVMVTNN